MNNVTFKKEPASKGLARIGEGTTVHMKIKKKRFGSICSPAWNQKFTGWKITFAVKDDKSCCGWSWKSVKNTMESLDDAKLFAKEYFKDRNDLHFFED